MTAKLCFVRCCRSVRKATRAPALGCTWARASGATATATPAAVTRRAAAVWWVLTPPPPCFFACFDLCAGICDLWKHICELCRLKCSRDLTSLLLLTKSNVSTTPPGRDVSAVSPVTTETQSQAAPRPVNPAPVLEQLPATSKFLLCSYSESHKPAISIKHANNKEKRS